MTKTKIDWCDYTWNPVWGCRNDCPYCYARATAKRWGLSFEPHWMERNFSSSMPKKPSRIFVNSMSDIMYWKHDWWSRVIQRIKENPQHTFMFLTRQPSIYNRLIPSNCWLGATVTNSEMIYNAQVFMSELNYNRRFLSIEPILEKIFPVCIDPNIIDWVILGAETGNRKHRVIPPKSWIEPFLKLPIPLYMKNNLPWDGRWRIEFPK